MQADPVWVDGLCGSALMVFAISGVIVKMNSSMAWFFAACFLKLSVGSSFGRAGFGIFMVLSALPWQVAQSILANFMPSNSWNILLIFGKTSAFMTSAFSSWLRSFQ